MWMPTYTVLSLLLISSECLNLPTPEARLSDEKLTKFKEIAEKLKGSINSAVDPCVSFNDYICGSVHETNIVSKSEITTNELFDDDELQEVLGKYLPKNDEDMIEAEKKMKNFLTSCKNKDKFDMTQFLRQYKFPGAIESWPVFDANWTSGGKNFDLVSAIAEFELFSNSIVVRPIFKERNGKFVVSISPKVIPVVSDESSRQEKTKLISDVLQSYGGILVNEDVTQFEEEYLKGVTINQAELPIEIDYKTLKEKLPEFQWDKYFEIILGVLIDDDTPILLENLESIRQLYSNVENMDQKVVAKYFLYLLMRHLHFDIGSETTCYGRLFLHFESVISRLVIKNLYNDTFKTLVIDMLHSVIDTMRDSLHDFNGKSTENIMSRIATFLDDDYLPNLSDETVNGVYAKIDMDPENFYGNTLGLYRYYMQTWLKSLLDGQNIGFKIVNRRLISYIFIRSLYEYYRKPSPLLFDMIATPLLRKSLTLLAPDRDYDDSIKECFRRQLNTSEKIRFSDIVSVKAVEVYIKSYDRWAVKYPEVVAIENNFFKDFDLTVKKILFAIHVQSSCRIKHSRENAGYLRTLFLSEIPNLEDFAEEYHCPIGSPMNPREKCIIT